MAKQKDELSWRIGGPQGSGVDTAAGIFQRACAIAGLHVFGRREYYSNIKGRHSYYDVRVAHRPLTSHRERVDLLVSFEPETLVRHALAVVPGGAIVYNARDLDMRLEKITFLDKRVRDDLTAYLEERGLPATTTGVLEDAKQRGVQVYEVPFSDLSQQLAEKLDVPKAIADRTLNTMAVAVSGAMLEFPAEYVVRGMAHIFKGRQKIIDLNKEAIYLVYEFVRENLDIEPFAFGLEAAAEPKPRLLLNGNQVVGLGKLAGGLTFQTYYPISPATDESVFLEAHSRFPLRNGQEGSVVIVQTEDELAAFAMAAGAALTGARSATATSGPGFSLMIEGLGWASMNEVPVVVTLYMRGGPSTGMPTRTDQADLLFAIRGGHGEAPRIVLASGDLEEAFYDAARAFNYAERFQMPVIHLVDKALASTTQTLEPFDLSKVRIERGTVLEAPPSPNGVTPYPRFQFTETGISPRVILGTPGVIHWYTGAEHTELGRVTEDPVIRERMMEKRMRKLEVAAREIPPEEKLAVHGDPEATFTVVSWGSTKGAILEALELLAKDGIRARFVQVRLMWPFPAEEIRPYIETAQPLVVAELSYTAHIDQLLRETTGRGADYFVLKYSGRPFAGEKMYEALKQIHEGTAEKRIVLRNPIE